MVVKRRSGTAIVETRKGILVVRIRGSEWFILPGGGAKGNESEKNAAIRELREETSLIATDCRHLFDTKGSIHKDYSSGRIVQNHHKIFLIEAKGKPKPKAEIDSIKYYKSNSKIRLTATSKRIIGKYMDGFNERE
jgi:8-oxo-dGTP pyrophosphatase MutT (NUDIX family)